MIISSSNTIPPYVRASNSGSVSITGGAVVSGAVVVDGGAVVTGAVVVSGVCADAGAFVVTGDNVVTGAFVVTGACVVTGDFVVTAACVVVGVVLSGVDEVDEGELTDSVAIFVSVTSLSLVVGASSLVSTLTVTSMRSVVSPFMLVSSYTCVVDSGVSELVISDLLDSASCCGSTFALHDRSEHDTVDSSSRNAVALIYDFMFSSLI